MKRSRMRQRSAKRAALYAGTEGQEGRAAFVGRILTERPVCQAREKVALHFVQSGFLLTRSLGLFGPFGCTYYSTEVHEILARSAGGDILDEENVLALCHWCHDWVGRNPRIAQQLGLRRSRYAGRNDAVHES